MSIYLELLCFVARRAVKSLERTGETAFRLRLQGTNWTLSLVRKPTSVAQRVARKPRSTSIVPTLPAANTDTLATADGEEPAIVLTDLGKSYLRLTDLGTRCG